MTIYSEKDIVRSYNEARNKRQQIKILAELNAADPAEIIYILQKHGVDLPESKPKNDAGGDGSKKAIPLSIIEAVTIHKRQLEKEKNIIENQIEELDKFLHSVVCE